MKRMGFYVNCLSAEMHADPFFHGARGVWELLQCGVLFVCVYIWIFLRLCVNVYLFGVPSKIWGKTGMNTYLYRCLS